MQYYCRYCTLLEGKHVLFKCRHCRELTIQSWVSFWWTRPHFLSRFLKPIGLVCLNFGTCHGTPWVNLLIFYLSWPFFQINQIFSCNNHKTTLEYRLGRLHGRSGLGSWESMVFIWYTYRKKDTFCRKNGIFCVLTVTMNYAFLLNF